MTSPTPDPLLDELRTALVTVGLPPLCEAAVEREVISARETYTDHELPAQLVTEVLDWLGRSGTDELVVYRVKLSYHLAGRVFVGFGDLPDFVVEQARSTEDGLPNLLDYATNLLATTVRSRAQTWTQVN